MSKFKVSNRWARLYETVKNGQLKLVLIEKKGEDQLVFRVRSRKAGGFEFEIQETITFDSEKSRDDYFTDPEYISAEAEKQIERAEIKGEEESKHNLTLLKDL